ncbi:MAG: DUF3275 family protein [Hydrogenophilales bacterium]|nr:DUF3275 family protein [Hydrogenophilales bacterium]
MISIQGKLSIKEVSGKSGSFCVGDLITDIGSFKVKDAILDQYSAGEYEGSFVIDEIFPSSYTWRGKVWVEVRARLSAIHVDSEPDTPDTETLPETVEPDPADEVPATRTEPTEAQTGGPDNSVPKSAASLFDDETQGLIAIGKPVKLDPTVDRGLFRSQRDALKGQGYRFDARTQLWTLTAE